MLKIWQVVISTTVLMVTTNVNAALIDRGNGLIYDTDFDITWLQDANYSMTSGYDSDGLMTWSESQAWMNTLNDNEYLGFNGWRLPDADVNNDGAVTDCLNSSAAACLDNETGYLFYHNNISVSDSGMFYNISPTYYWTNTDLVDTPTHAWILNFDHGAQGYQNKEQVVLVSWAVHDGDIGATVVPVPAAVWLFGSGLIGLVGLAKRKKHKS